MSLSCPRISSLNILTTWVMESIDNTEFDCLRDQYSNKKNYLDKLKSYLEKCNLILVSKRIMQNSSPNPSLQQTQSHIFDTLNAVT